jgi:hypothetical protein
MNQYSRIVKIKRNEVISIAIPVNKPVSLGMRIIQFLFGK